MDPVSILLVTRDPDVVQSVARVVRSLHGRLTVALSVQEARPVLDRSSPDAVLMCCDGASEGLTGVLRNEGDEVSTPPVIVCAPGGSIADAVRAIRTGADNFLCGTPKDATSLMAAVRTARAQQIQSASGTNLRRGCTGLPGVHTLDIQMRRVCATLTAVADSRASILLEGESGTGRRLLAKAVHHRSRRLGAPFFELACGILSDSVPDGALSERIRNALAHTGNGSEGRLGAAVCGTLFLDDVTRASTPLQHELMRALDSADGCLGDPGSKQRTSLRTISTAGPSLGQMLRNGRMSMEFYHRVSTVTVRVPPLRERVADIPLLAKEFLLKLADRHGSSAKAFEQDALSAMVRYSWPGNVRELRNAVEHGIILSGPGTSITLEALPKVVQDAFDTRTATQADERLPLKDALRDPEKRYLLSVLRKVTWNKQRAARELGISRSTLYKKMKEYGLTDGVQCA